MNRNVESHFSLNPTTLDIRRSQFDRSSGVKFSGNVGDLIPFFVDEVLPGDTFKVKTSKVVRFETLLHPIMDSMYLDTYYFFVPNRIVWDHWKYFCGESAQAWTPAVEYRIPKINIDADHPHPGVGSLADYLGIPLNVRTSTADLPDPTKAFYRGINALPFRAYAKVCNDWFRSEVLQDELVIPTGDSDVFIGSLTDSDLYCANGGPVYKACKYHDYFTSCLPAPQSGPAVHIPFSGPLANDFYGSAPQFAPVSTLGSGTYDSSVGFDKTSLEFKASGNYVFPAGNHTFFSQSDGVNSRSFLIGRDSDAGNIVGHGLYPSNLFADVGSWLGTINDLRIAFQVQKFYEKMARGRRYIEVLKSQFGVTSPDARLQRSEYLGGNRVPISISEVTANASNDNSVVGDLGAMSRTNDVHEDFVHSFTEHGFVIGVCVVRYDHSYPQGLERFWQRTSMFDYYWPVFANIGEQPVRRGEINFMSGSLGIEHSYDVFGYQEAWADYRYKPSRVCGYLRPEAPGTLSSWHLSDFYDQTSEGPFLSDSWVREDGSIVDRVLAVASSETHQFIADFYVKNICSRVMPLYSIPGLADHH